MSLRHRVYKTVETIIIMVLNSINEWSDLFTQIMNTGLIKNDWLYIDLWSAAHIAVGLILMYLIVEYKIFHNKKTKQYALILVIAVGWEVYEWIFYSRGIFFAVDTKANLVWDIISGMIGAWLYIKGDKLVNREVKELEKIKG